MILLLLEMTEYWININYSRDERNEFDERNNYSRIFRIFLDTFDEYYIINTLSRPLFDHSRKIHDIELKKQHTDVCSVCLDEFCETVGILPCGHAFHKACITKWLNNNDSCPNCRDDLTSRVTVMTQECSNTYNKFLEIELKKERGQEMIRIHNIIPRDRTRMYFRNVVKDNYRFKRQNRVVIHNFHH